MISMDMLRDAQRVLDPVINRTPPATRTSATRRC